jgi:hypothetical protein
MMHSLRVSFGSPLLRSPGHSTREKRQETANDLLPVGRANAIKLQEKSRHSVRCQTMCNLKGCSKPQVFSY